VLAFDLSVFLLATQGLI